MKTHPAPPLSLDSTADTRGFRLLASGLLAVAGTIAAQAVTTFPGGTSYEWDLELTSMDLNANGVLLPLGPGWSPILTDIHIGESVNLASNGKAFAFNGFPGVDARPALLAAEPHRGEPFYVNSFFDVFFDIRVTDVDPSLNFGGGPTDGLSLLFPDNGPAHMENFYKALFDPDVPNFGLVPPPEASPYIGHFNVEIPLGADLNGNGENDKIKFTLVAHTVGDENRTFIILPDGTVVDSFDSVLDLGGAVVDESQDPPFSVQLTGPTTATSRLVVVPESATSGAGWMTALLAVASWRRKLP